MKTPVKIIDDFLNGITMYRLVLYGLALIALIGVIFSVVGVLSFSTAGMLVSLAVLLAVCVGTNKIFAYIFGVPNNVESAYITALILFLILPPATNFAGGLTLVAVGLAAMASKYVINWNGKHIFNPAALGAVLIGISGMGAATWWVGSKYLFVPVAIIGLLMVRKVRWSWLFLSFLVLASISVGINGLRQGVGLRELLVSTYFSGPIIFFGAIMLTEPTTTPPGRKLQVIYGALVGALYGITFHLGLLYNSPELALLLGNIYSYIASPKGRFNLRLKEKIKLGPMLYDFVFAADQPVKYTAGQYMEWTTWPKHSDSRGNRRYFTLASAPAENTLRIGVKIPEQASSFKRYLSGMKPGDRIMAGHLSGDFTLSGRQAGQTIVGIAGGIGITPFRSMVKDLISRREKVNMVLFYAAADPKEFVYQDVFQQGQSIGLKTVYILSGSKNPPQNWNGKIGFITDQMVQEEVPNYQNARYYLSGPNAMVDAYKKLLSGLNVPRPSIRTDYFPGY